ncbi:hypothetical protein R1CP_21075 [Rhodococcus opacus]|uniref:Uncharacterized protein n=1 Tax=Rhodococcus opacus TaxID=37919 RepID=A0A1B1K8C7_RHOOP|nr:hypothetical protein R1CP_21075 [Rhodococcus opacus]
MPNSPWDIFPYNLFNWIGTLITPFFGGGS